MEFLIIGLVAFYLIMAQSFLRIWFKFFQQDNSMSREEKQLSWLILLIGTVLWPLVVPIAYLSLLEKKFKSQVEIICEDEPLEPTYSLQKRRYTDKFATLESFYHTFHTFNEPNCFGGMGNIDNR